MLRGLWTAASGMAAQQLNVDIIANNLSNVNTTGFKKSRADFQDLMYQTLRTAGATTAAGNQLPTGIQIGMGAKAMGIQKMFSQGDYNQTGNELDLAIEGKGFFKVVSNDEEVYTRSGGFKIDSEGYICTPAGDRLQPEITIPSNAVSISIDSAGRLVAWGQDKETPVLETDIKLYTFPNPAGLHSMGRNLYRPTAASGEATEGTPGSDGVGTLAQGYLEMSNVNVVEEMVSMIIAQRAYEVNSKAIQTADNMLQMANNIKR
ncbi:MAG: flagellar basal-body rod protein FlgG [Deltaproteobacteria bacterium]|nr:flagellar basal-body rod protein FlgG [Deltaproteobacteria bacterium]MBW2019130.1 flagellar basal-body rod protein FlgG [Deltaproteobacteria bacterium]MBW2073197.1 flagellar basal-body rod protein FlgG [Deltaproteobacteria bacterium]RLB83817.1 MAG: flagellar basal-body rod protein FlgG [Deltaproteobacteria bacterium]